MEKNQRRERFRVVSVSRGRAVVAYRSDNFQFEVSAADLEFLCNGKFIMPNPGEDIEAVVVGAGEGLREVFIFGHEHEHERASYEGVAPTEQGWTPYFSKPRDAGK
jgi:hypothetical protein